MIIIYKKYIIFTSCRDSSGSEDSGTDDERENVRKSTIPDWARGAQLKEALEVLKVEKESIF